MMNDISISLERESFPFMANPPLFIRTPLLSRLNKVLTGIQNRPHYALALGYITSRTFTPYNQDNAKHLAR